MSLLAQRRAIGLAAFMGLAAVSAVVRADTTNAIWTGGGGSSTNWGNASNWQYGQNPNGGGQSIVHFAGVTSLVPYNDYGGYTQFNQILFDAGAGPFTLSGAAIKLASNGGSVAKIENNSVTVQTVNFNSNNTSIVFNSSGELDPTKGDLTVNNNLYFDGGGTLSVYGDPGHVLTLNGTLNNGGVTASLSVQTGVTAVLNGANTYTGVTRITEGTLSIGNLANGGVASGIGKSASDAGNLVFNGGTLRYTGAAVDTDRSFTIGTNGATLDASGTGNVRFTNTGYVFYAADDFVNHTLTLTGTNTAINTLGLRVGDFNAANTTSVAKTGVGKWLVTNANTYTGGTTITAGTLQANNSAGALGTGMTVVSGASATARGVLAGTGATGGDVTVNRYGTITAGTGATASDGVSTLTTGNQIWAAGGQFVAKFNHTTNTLATPADTNWDKLAMGTLAVNASPGDTFQVRIVNSSGMNITLAANQQFALATTTSQLTATDIAKFELVLDQTITVDSGHAAVLKFTNSSSGSTLMLDTTPIATPEPTTTLLAGLSAGVLLTRRRR